MAAVKTREQVIEAALKQILSSREMTPLDRARCDFMIAGVMLREAHKRMEQAWKERFMAERKLKKLMAIRASGLGQKPA